MKKLLSATLLMLTITVSSAALAHSEWYGKEGQEDMPSYMETALSRLPAKKAAEFRETMKEAREDNKDLQEQTYRLHNDLHAILTAPTFDKDAFLAKRTQLQKLQEEMEENRTEAFASAVSELSQKDRVILTRSLHRERSHNRHMAHMQNDKGAMGEPNASIQH
jgi:uncharacterized membrane protein